MISLLAAAAAASKLAALSLGCRCLSPRLVMISLLAAAAALSPKLVSLHDFALGCLCRLVFPSLSPFMISLLAAAAALSPKLVSLHDLAAAAFGCRCRLVSQACLPS